MCIHNTIALSLMYVPDTPHYYHGVVTLGCVISSLTFDGEEVPSCEMEGGLDCAEVAVSRQNKCAERGRKGETHILAHFCHLGSIQT